MVILLKQDILTQTNSTLKFEIEIAPPSGEESVYHSFGLFLFNI